MSRFKEYEELERRQKRYGSAYLLLSVHFPHSRQTSITPSSVGYNFNGFSVVLGEILREHPELTQCIQAIGMYIVDKMEKNEKRIIELYGKHGEGLIVE